MRIPSYTIEDAPEAARPLLAEMVQFSPVFTSCFFNYAETELDVPAAGE